MSAVVSLSQPAPTGGLQINLSSGSNTVLSVAPAVVTIAAGQSTASITYTGLSVGSTMLTATSSVAGLVSAAVSVSAPPVTPMHLAFTVQPTTITQGAFFTPAPAISVLDNSGNVVTNSTAAITLTLGGTTTGAVLSGPTTVTSIRGVAGFQSLSVGSSGTAYTLIASSPGLIGTVSVTFNVTSPVNSAGVIPNNAISSGDLSGASNWQWNHDPGTPGTSSGTTTYAVNGPSVDGAAREFSVNYSSHGGEIYHLTFAHDSSATHFVYDTFVYINDPTQLQNLELDMNQVMANGQTVIFGTQCASGSGTWEYTKIANGGTHWYPSNVRCNIKKWTANTWHHVQIASHRDAGGVVTYDWVSVDGVQNSFQNATGPSALSLRWGMGDLLLNFQVDGSSATTGSINAYIDKMIIYRW